MSTALLLLFLALAVGMQHLEASYDLRYHLSSKTPYDHARPYPGSVPALEGMPHGSKPLYLYFVGRHGNRWPMKSGMESIESLKPLFQAANNTEEHPWTKSWQTPFAKQDAGQLNPTGEEEMQALGSRFRDLFPTLLGRPYSPSAYQFISTQAPRTAASASAFAQGLFPAGDEAVAQGEGLASKGWGKCSSQPIALDMRSTEADTLLKFYAVCPAYFRYREALDPLMASWLTEVGQGLAQGVERKLRLPEGSFTARNVSALWQLCAWEATVEGDQTRACSLFDQSTIEEMEFAQDVKHFHAHGYGACEAYSMAVSLAGDLVERVQQAAQHREGGEGGEDEGREEGTEGARFHFAHDGTISGLAAILGLFGSPGECASKNTTQAIPGLPRDRIWKNSAVSPFAANLAVLLYEPSGGQSTRLVRFLWNERAIPIPGCGGHLDCKVDDFLDFYGGLAESERFDEVCNVDRLSGFEV